MDALKAVLRVREPCRTSATFLKVIIKEVK